MKKKNSHMTEKYEPQMVKGLCNHVYDNSHVFVVNVYLQLMSFMANNEYR